MTVRIILSALWIARYRLPKRRTWDKLRLKCSVGVAYSKAAAKTASEEKKPDGYFEILTARDFVALIHSRDVKVLNSVGPKTAQKLNAAGIYTVDDVRQRREEVVRLLGKQGRWITQLAFGVDDRKVILCRPEDAKSVSREITFQEDVSDYEFLKDVLLLLSLCVENRAGLYGNGVSLKLTYANMKSISRSRGAVPCDSAVAIYREAARMLDGVEKAPARLIGVGVYNLSANEFRQLTLDELVEDSVHACETETNRRLDFLRQKYRLDFAGHLEQLYHAETLHKTVFYAQYARICAHRGSKRAYLAVAHSMLIAIYHILKDNVPFHDLGANYYNQFNKDSKIRAYLKKLHALGWSEPTATVVAPV